MSLYVFTNALPSWEAENTRAAFKVVSVFSSVQNVDIFIYITQTVLRKLCYDMIYLTAVGLTPRWQ
jgi:hypothetical protein